MTEIGEILREARETLGLTLEEVERVTRIRTYHLEALEAGDFEALPSPVQVRGFLHNYAEFLGLNTDEILLRYAESLQQQHRTRPAGTLDQPAARPTVQVRSRRPRWLTSDLFISAGIVLVVLVVLLWGGTRIAGLVSASGEAAEMTASFEPATATSGPAPQQTIDPSLETTLLASTPIIADDTVIPTPPLQLGAGVNIRVIATQRSWVEIAVDGEQVFRDRMEPGDIRDYAGRESVSVTTANGAGVRVFFNGEDQGVMGAVGEIVIQVWTLSGAITPTATITPTSAVPTEAPETPTPTPDGFEGGQ
jgi:cytoskeleton protein RodZ